MQGFCFEFGPIHIGAYIETLPIGKACALHGAITEVEAQGTYQVEARAGKDARAADVAGVGGDFGLYEYDVEHAKVLSLCQNGNAY